MNVHVFYPIFYTKEITKFEKVEEKEVEEKEIEQAEEKNEQKSDN